MLLAYVISKTYKFDPQGIIGNKIEGLGLVVLLAAILHSGIISGFQKRKLKFNHSLISFIFLNIISFSASMYILTYITELHLTFVMELILKIFFFGIAVWSAYKWATGKDEGTCIQRLLLAFGALIGYLFVAEASWAIVYWLIMLLLPIGWLFLYSDRDQKLSVFWIPSVLFMSGLPFSFSFLGLKDFIGNNMLMDLLLITTPMVIVISGYIKHAGRKDGKFNYLEPWYQIIYLIGLFLPTISMVAVFLKNSQHLSEEIGGWWLGLVILILSILFYIFQIKPQRQIGELNSPKRFSVGGVSISVSGTRTIIEKLAIIFENFFVFITNLFEGAGGILWSLIFLVLFVTILRFQGGF